MENKKKWSPVQSRNKDQRIDVYMKHTQEISHLERKPTSTF